MPSCGVAAAAPHAVSGGGEACGGQKGGGRRGRRARGGERGLGGRWRGGAHVICGLKVGALGGEELEAVKLAVARHQHEGCAAALRRRGGGGTRAERRRRGVGVSRGGGRRGRRARGAGCCWGAAGGAALTSSVASRSAPLATRSSSQLRLPKRAACMRAVLPSCGGAVAVAHAVSCGGEARRSRGGRRRGRQARGAAGGWRAAGGAALTSSVASRLAPLVIRSSRQSSLPNIAANKRAVSPSCGGEAAAAHAVSGGGEGARLQGRRRRGRRARGGGGLGGRGRRGAHVACGVELGTLGD